MRYTDRLLILIVLVLLVLGSMFAVQNRRLVRPAIEQENNIPDTEPAAR